MNTTLPTPTPTTEGTLITAYQFNKIVNRELQGYGVEKVLPPQMFYTYYKKGFIKIQTEVGAVEWTYKYVTKNFPQYL
jgi:hypothetical protein